ncbi:MAG: hypothetical protein DRI95_03730 [Bacteroidetes bacterium]|nr:MAG: hypothetical protein DRI95_03730 [Bacteroidota bacterium]
MKIVNTKKTPVYRDTGFYLENNKKTISAFSEETNHPHNPTNYIYSRYRNPTIVSVENQLKKIEDANWAILTQSGMSAIDVALSIFQHKSNKNKWMFFNDIYGGTNTYIDEILVNRRGIEIKRFYSENNTYNYQKLINQLDEFKPELLYFETISNPMLIIADGQKIIHEAKKREITVIIDNTFASPYLWKPLMHGADLVIHSATKYLAGHGNITAGVVCGNSNKLMQKAIEYRKLVGHMISPDDAYRLGDQLQTFNLRFSKQSTNAKKLADFLNKSPMVNKVFYPGLENHPTHAEASQLFNGKGYGAMITFQLAGENNVQKRKRCDLFIEKISDYFHLIPTLGDVETIFLPVDAVWADKYPFPGTIRLSVGIEDYDYLENIFSDILNQLS